MNFNIDKVLQKNKPMRENIYSNERPRLDDMERDVIDHEGSAAPLITNVSPYF